MMNFLTKVFGTKHDRDVKKMRPLVDQINGFALEYQSLSDELLRGKTDEFRKRLSDATASAREQLNSLRDELEALGRDDDRTDLLDEIGEVEAEIKKIEQNVLDEVHPEAFAVFKETCRRFKEAGKRWERAGDEIVWDMIPFDVQLIGATVLHQGKIAEMATGEGKTLVAGLALYLNGITGRGVHLVTVNSFLAKRDAMWLGPVFIYLGLTVGIIQDRALGAEAYVMEGDGQGGYRMRECEHKDAYATDIVYGTKDQFGFDYLYDNMSVRPEDLMQREHNFAIVDEVDSILIDEARTPLIISGPVQETTSHRYEEMRPHVEKLVRAQTKVVNEILKRAEEELETGDEYQAGIWLLQVQRGMPKNGRLMKLLQQEGVKRLINRVEADYIRDKRVQELDDDLYFSIDEKSHINDLTEKGREAISNEPNDFVLPDLDETLQAIEADGSLSDEEKLRKQDAAYQDYAQKSERIHSVQQLLSAYTLYEKDVRYMVVDGKVVIVDEFTGRPQPGRRFSNGLHQALEAKERVKVERDTQTVATVTLQNYFRLYDRLAGMTGTAETEASEFLEIYGLDVVVIPTNEPIRRVDGNDWIYRSKREKYTAIVNEVAELHEQNLPVLVGTVTVETSELLSRMLTRKGIKHQVLNARQNEQEAQIVSLAGQPGAVTIATNMAGRGTDIKLGKGVIKAPEGHQCALISSNNGKPLCPYVDEYKCREAVPCGLQIIGTERHESRRIDRQLRGRAGRQGDPGSSRFFISLEDDLMRLFQSDRIARVMDRLGAEEGEVIEHPWVTRSIGKAQQRVEARNFEFRRQVLEYDDVMNQQREVIYDRRRHALEEEDISSLISDMINDTVDDVLATHVPPDAHPEDWNFDGLMAELRNLFLQAPAITDDDLPKLRQEGLRDRILEGIRETYDRREQLLGAENMRQVERMIYLSVFDEKWKEHLREMDDLKEGIGLRSYGQKNPLIEYKREGYTMFVALLEDINREALRLLFRISIEERPPQPRLRQTQRLSLVHEDATGMGFAGMPEPAAVAPDELATNSAEGAPPKKQPIRNENKVGRNEPCPCGSGKKYKQCHGRG
jgi:preprotein translocase subunit SecA